MFTNVIIHAIYNRWKQNTDLSISFPHAANSYNYTVSMSDFFKLKVKQDSSAIRLWRSCIVSVCVWVCMKVKVTQSCLTLCDPMDYTVHGILQARIMEWVVVPFSREWSQPRDRTQVSCIAGRFFTSWATREAIYIYIYNIPEIIYVMLCYAMLSHFSRVWLCATP